MTLNWAGLRRFFASKALLPERFLATILFTDIVESTARTSELGDTAWTELLAHHERDVRGELERAHGREVKTTGDGVLAVFEGPCRAPKCRNGHAALKGTHGSVRPKRHGDGRSSRTPLRRTIRDRAAEAEGSDTNEKAYMFRHAIVVYDRALSRSRADDLQPVLSAVTAIAGA